MERAGKGM
jgi:hypothetical protein